MAKYGSAKWGAGGLFGELASIFSLESSGSTSFDYGGCFGGGVFGEGTFGCGGDASVVIEYSTDTAGSVTFTQEVL